ncbi:MAG: hypothetical protein SF339_05125 [Blastocatellia bacterium]|nr:hypothetical protein [Blastocatellia bacterium]
MTPKTYRALGLVYCGIAAVIAIMNLKGATSSGMKFVPAILLVLGIMQFARARRLEQKQSS